MSSNYENGEHEPMTFWPGGGECKIVASSTDGLTTNDPKKWFELSCGHSFMLYGFDAPICCPVCGRTVKR